MAIHEAMPSIKIFADLCTFLAYPPHALCLAFLSFRSKVKNVVRGLEAARGSAKAGAAGASNSTAAVTSMVDLGSGDGRYDSHACCATWHICLWPSVCLSFRREGKERERGTGRKGELPQVQCALPRLPLFNLSGGCKVVQFLYCTCRSAVLWLRDSQCMPFSINMLTRMISGHALFLFPLPLPNNNNGAKAGDCCSRSWV